MIPKDMCPNSGAGCRIREGAGTTTLAFYQPVYNEFGVNVNPDMNITTIPLTCDTCGRKFISTYQNGNRTVVIVPEEPKEIESAD